jgi:amidohydrolase
MKRILSFTAGLALSFTAFAQNPPDALRASVKQQLDEAYPALEALYKHLHSHPELSFYEIQTAKRMAEELHALGFEVTEKVGGNGVVGVLRNGNGPTILLRTDLDGLPVEEQTGLPYASKTRVKDEKGNDVFTMHACGHDVHMTAWIGTARVLSRIKDRWQGTLVMMGQPAEERVSGAKAMLADGLFTKFPRPDYCLALHVAADLATGLIGYTEGFALANSDSVDIVVKGVGGHGAFPHKTKDPVVLASEIVLALQTIVSREIAPGEPAVITVGSIHGGTKHNIIPDEVRLQLTLRSYTDEVREQTLAAIRRITRGLALAAGMPEDRLPVVTVAEESARATYNQPELTRRLTGVFQAWLGAGTAVERKPVMGAEDFGLLGRTEHKVPIAMFWLGAVDSDLMKESLKTGKSLPALHSSLFRPVPASTIKTGVTALTGAVLELAPKK